MNLADMLCYADIHQLNRIAKAYRCDCDGHSKNDLIQSIIYSVTRREAMNQLMTEMEREDLQFLQSLLFDKRDVFSIEELTARAKQTLFQGNEERSPREMIIGLTQKGWLFQGVTHQTRMLFQMPLDVKNRMIDSLRKKISSELVFTEQPSFYRDEQRILLEDLNAFLSFVQQNDLLLTSDGAIYRRQQQLLLNQLFVKEEPVNKGGWRFGYGRRFKEYPDRFSFIYDYCYFHQYIEERQGTQLIVTPMGEMRLAEKTMEELSQVYRFWLRLYRGPIRNLHVLVRLIDLAANQRWVTVASLKQLMLPYIKTYYYDTPDSIVEKRVLRMMFHLGLLQIGTDEEVGAVTQITPNGHRLIHGIEISEDEIIELDQPNEANPFPF